MGYRREGTAAFYWRQEVTILHGCAFFSQEMLDCVRERSQLPHSRGGMGTSAFGYSPSIKLYVTLIVTVVGTHLLKK